MTNSPEELAPVTLAAKAFLQGNGVDDRTVYLVNLVLEEVLTNIIKYAYGDEDEHVIGIELAVDQQDVLVATEDDGREFDPLSVPPPSAGSVLEDCEPGGLGIHLIRSLSHSMEYVRQNERNRLVIRLLKS